MENKRFEVNVVVGCHFGDIAVSCPPEVILDCESHFFDTIEEASEFAARYPKEKIHITDRNEDLPF